MAIAFRADEAAEVQFEKAKRYLVDREWSSKVRSESIDCLRELTYKYGPVISRYPTWHPLVRNHEQSCPEVWPSERTGLAGLDHTVGFANALLTCPYAASDNVERLRNSLRNLPQHHSAFICEEPIEAEFYHSDATPILIVCHWSKPTDVNYQIPKSLAVPLMVENELRSWGKSKLAERWDTMQPYLLGDPHGARSSLFVSQETAIAMKRTYLSLVESGMFGPLRMD